MQRDVLARVADPSVRTYVVWVPMSRGLERDVPNATKEVWDSRASHYWDDQGWLMNAYKDVLHAFPLEPVWDTYLLYGPDAQWVSDKPPAPLYWMHQLGSPRAPRAIGPFWNPDTFREHVLALAR